MNDFIEIRNSKRLSARIPCERIAVGRRGDYKPCIVKLPSGELLIVAFHQHKLDQYERLLLFRSKDGGRHWHMGDLGSYYGEMSPAILRLRDGRLLMTFTLRAAVAPNLRPLGVRCIVGKETSDGFQFDFKHG